MEVNILNWLKRLRDWMQTKDAFVGKWVPKSNDLFEQVGRVRDNNALDAVAKWIIKNLNLTKKDVVLDVCCGNGLLTKRVAPYVKEIVGVDISEELIRNAKRYSSGKNIKYFQRNALEIGNLFPSNYFDKSYCYLSFQYFDLRSGKKLIEVLSDVTKANGLILIGDIPNKEIRWIYYNTLNKKIKYIMLSLVNRILEIGMYMGRWWDPNEIFNICSELGLDAKILIQDNTLPDAHFRFDVLILNTKK